MSERIAVAFQPTYFPDIHYLHRMAIADVIIVLDNARFNRRSGNHHRAKLPGGTLTVPIRRTEDSRWRPFASCQAEFNGWQLEHVRQLQQWYPEHQHNLADALDLIANFPTNYCRGVDAMLELLCEYLPHEKSQEIVWQSSPDFEDIRSTGTSALVALCQRMEATHYLCGHIALNDYLDAERFADAGISIRVQDIEFPRYTSETRDHWNWSSLDIIAHCGLSGTQTYLESIEDLGWTTYAKRATGFI